MHDCTSARITEFEKMLQGSEWHPTSQCLTVIKDFGWLLSANLLPSHRKGAIRELEATQQDPDCHGHMESPSELLQNCLCDTPLGIASTGNKTGREKRERWLAELSSII